MKIAHLTSIHPQNDNRIFYKECITLSNNRFDITFIVAGCESREINDVKVVGYPRGKVGRLKRIVKTSLLDMIKICKEELHVNIQKVKEIYNWEEQERVLLDVYKGLKE